MDKEDGQKKSFGKIATLAEYCELVTGSDEEAEGLFAAMVDEVFAASEE